MADAPDGQSSLARYYSKAIGGQNMARFRMPAFDALYEKMQGLPDGHAAAMRAEPLVQVTHVRLNHQNM